MASPSLLTNPSLREFRAHYHALASVTRLRILQYLAGIPEITVLELADAIGISQPRLCWHLRMLRRGQVVRARPGARPTRGDRHSPAPPELAPADVATRPAGPRAAGRAHCSLLPQPGRSACLPSRIVDPDRASPPGPGAATRMERGVRSDGNWQERQPAQRSSANNDERSA